MKSIGALLAGFVTIFVLSVATDALLESTGILPPVTHPEAYTAWMLWLVLLYRCVYAIGGFYLTARLAPNRPMRHALILGIIGTIIATLGAIANWKLGNSWYPILLAASTLPCAYISGKLARKSK